MLRYLEYCFYKYCYYYSKKSKRFKDLTVFWGNSYIDLFLLLNLMIGTMLFAKILFKTVNISKMFIWWVAFLPIINVFCGNYFTDKKYEELKKKYEYENNAKLKGIGVFLHFFLSVIIVMALFLSF